MAILFLDESGPPGKAELRGWGSRNRRGVWGERASLTTGSPSFGISKCRTTAGISATNESFTVTDRKRYSKYWSDGNRNLFFVLTKFAYCIDIC